MTPLCAFFSFIFLLTTNLCFATNHEFSTTNGISTTAQSSSTVPPGIDIPYIMARSACQPDLQPQFEHNLTFGYLVSPEPDRLKNRTDFNCTWVLQVSQNQTIKSTLMHFDLAPSLHVDFHDGLSEQAPLIASYHGRMSRAFFQTKSSSLFIRYYGPTRLASISEFYAYVERSQPAVWCHLNESLRCRSGQKCVPLAQKCDGTFNCKDGTDEEDCPQQSLHFTRPCGLKNELPDELGLNIVGGKASLPNSWPWIVSLRRTATEPDGHTCGGTIINRKWILTAAHCAQKYPKVTEWTVNAGKYQKLNVHEPTEVLRYIKRMVVHEHFIGGDEDDEDSGKNKNLTWYDYNANDIALLELNAPLPDNDPAVGALCLANGSLTVREGLSSLVIGWGSTLMTGAELVLKEATVPVISNAKCHSWMPLFNIGPKQICAGFEKGGTDSCAGDSGGPLFVYNANSFRYDQIGIVSTGDRCGGKKEAGIYTRVSSFTDWIRNVTSDFTEN